MEWLSAIPVTGITATTLFVLLYIGQLRGWFYTKPQVEEIRADRDNRITEIRADYTAQIEMLKQTLETRLTDKDAIIANLMEAAAESKSTLAVAQNQITRLLDSVETTAAVVQAIPRSAEQQ